MDSESFSFFIVKEVSGFLFSVFDYIKVIIAAIRTAFTQQTLCKGPALTVIALMLSQGMHFDPKVYFNYIPPLFEAGGFPQKQRGGCFEGH